MSSRRCFFFYDTMVMHNVKLYATRVLRVLTLEEYPLLWTTRELTLCKKKALLRTFLKVVATLWKQGKISVVGLENVFIATRSCPENSCRYR